MKTIQLKCEHCETLFDRELKCHTYRALKMGLKSFCSRSCSTSYRNLHIPKEFYTRNAPRMRKLAGNKRDEFSPFRFFIQKCRSRNQEWNIDVQYLKELWETQKGICPYTGFKMELSATTTHYPTIGSPLKRASLDRIDSTKGYVKGNVEFVCLFINFAKNGYSKQDVMKFIGELKLAVLVGDAPTFSA